MKTSLAVLLFALILGSALVAHAITIEIGPSRQVKVFVITMFDVPVIGGETLRWIQNENLTEQIAIPGLSPNFPYIHCRPPKLLEPFTSDICVITTDQTYSNAATSMMATLFSGFFDFTHTYFIVAGIAGVDPADGTLGSAAWARWVVDYGLAFEIDARQIPEGYPYGYLPFGQGGPRLPNQPPTRIIGTETYRLNEALLQKALSLTQNLDLTVNDNARAQAVRANYTQAAARAPPSVIQCDSMAIDTYWHGSILSQRANDWAALLTNGSSNYCMTNEEDSATLTALNRGHLAGLLDFNRVAVLRTASNFDQEYTGQTPLESLQENSGGFIPSTANAYFVGSVLAHDIINNWHSLYRNGLPPV